MNNVPAPLPAAANTFDWRSFDAYLFDIDGTLLNSRDAVHYHAFHSAIQKVYNCNERIERVTVHGSTDVRILRDVLALGGIGEEAFREKLDDVLALMCEEVESKSDELRAEVCPGIFDLLDELRGAGKLLGVTTGNLDRIGWAKLKAAGLKEYFSFGSFSNRNHTRTEIFRWGAAEARRRLGADASVCFFGDTPADVQAARETGFPVVAVATGIYSMADLESEGPNLCISCCEKLWQSNEAL